MTDGILRSVFRGNTVTQAPYPMPTAVPLLDTYPNALFAYSLRKLRTAYAGSAVRIRRSGDSAETDIGFSGLDSDSAAVAAHLAGDGSTIAFVTTWYDQSGNGYDATQTSSTAQPTYQPTDLSTPSLGFSVVADGVGDFMTRSTVDFGTITQITVFSVMQQAGSNANNTLFSHDALVINCHATFGDVIYWDIANNSTGRINVSQPSGWDNNPHVLELYRDSGDSQGITVDGVSLITGSRTVDGSGSNVWRVGGHSGGFLHVGYISELIGWATDLGSTNRTGARTEINSYYAVF